MVSRLEPQFDPTPSAAHRADPTVDLPLPQARASRLDLLLPDTAPWRQDLVTVSHAVSYLRQLMRGNHITKKEFFARVSMERPPVLLLHGFLYTRGSLHMLETRLCKDGLCVLS